MGAGDWQWMKQACKLNGWKDGPNHRCCYACLADGRDRLRTDASQSAAWRPTCFVNMALYFLTAFRAGLCAGQLGGIYGWPAFRSTMCNIYRMHTGDMGVLSKLLGNCCWIVEPLGGCQSKCRHALVQLMSMIKLASKELQRQVPIHNITVGMLKPSASGTASLKAKAAESRYLLLVCHFVLQNFMNTNDEHAPQRLQCVEAFCKAYFKVDNWLENLSASSRRCWSAVHDCLVRVQQVSYRCVALLHDA